MQRVFSVVRYLHANGFSHRNIRAETILFETDTSLNELKFVDLLSIYEVAPGATYSTAAEDAIYEQIVKGSHFLNRAPEMLRLGEREFGYK